MKIADNKPDKYFSLIFIPEGWIDDILFGDLISFQ